MNGWYAEPDQAPVADALATELKSRTQWDEMPQWGTLDWEDGIVELFPMHVKAEAWKAAGHPRALLERMLRILTAPMDNDQQRQRRRAVLGGLPPTFAGVYIRFEGWAPPKDLEAEIFRRVEAGGSYPSVSSLPGRRELRSMVAADTAGRAYLLLQYRDEPDEITTIVEAVGGDAKVVGEMAPVLRGLVRALTAQKPVEQPDLPHYR